MKSKRVAPHKQALMLSLVDTKYLQPPQAGERFRGNHQKSCRKHKKDQKHDFFWLTKLKILNTIRCDSTYSSDHRPGLNSKHEAKHSQLQLSETQQLHKQLN